MAISRVEKKAQTASHLKKFTVRKGDRKTCVRSCLKRPSYISLDSLLTEVCIGAACLRELVRFEQLCWPTLAYFIRG
jgi:hypothetical protein